MSTASTDHVEKSVVLWHMQSCMATIYSQSKDSDNNNINKRQPLATIGFTNKARFGHQGLDSISIVAPTKYFQCLTTIQLQNNYLTSLPRELWRLTALRKLNVGHNQLAEIPADIGHLTQLEELYLHNNQLTTLPCQLGRLLSLEVLDVTHNPKMSWLPWELTLITTLKHVWLGGNSLLATPTTMSPTTIDTTTAVIPSLRDICIQLAGPRIMMAMEKKQDPPLSPFILQSILAAVDPSDDLNISLACKCSVCHDVLYFPGISLLQPHGVLCNQSGIPLLYKLCGQSCRNRWMNENSHLHLK
ncbi:uncharacterized protein BX664DRAFT_278911 [Halteromyces radiatus]|uniref:uncharacterized protein n=1 Tax=Halteromyces radiatus TaxID=101107 RepID=UPI00221EFEA5|nr:uncharacterized protein BX664DRAFT_278911 [Halteromyces radiatus]KAI8093775.1 hypothetical protein BX664DRAFT_278911 [Halteromyces radiatus]